MLAKQPKILIMATGEWVSTARLALALAEAGCEVATVCPRRHPVLSTRLRPRRYAYAPLRPLHSLQEAIALSAPDLLIAADELMVLHLEELWLGSADEAPMHRLIERSMGGTPVMAAARSRIALSRLAVGNGLAAPETLVVDSDASMASAIERLGLPLVLKADASSGGQGVRVIATAAEGQRGWRALQGPVTMPRAVKRAGIDGELLHLRQWLKRQRRGVTAQKFVQGHEMTAMAVCQRGRVLACVCFDVVHTWFERGPSSVVRVVEDAAMLNAVTRVSAELGVSGCCGFDFMQDKATGERLLIEMNPRPTQLVHLSFGSGRDLVAAYVRALGGLAVEDRACCSDAAYIGVFPHALARGATGDGLQGVHLDVPWDEPSLIKRACGGRVPSSLRNDPRWPSRDDAPVTAVRSQPMPKLHQGTR